jgi:hypothetical protein
LRSPRSQKYRSDLNDAGFHSVVSQAELLAAVEVRAMLGLIGSAWLIVLAAASDSQPLWASSLPPVTNVWGALYGSRVLPGNRLLIVGHSRPGG